MKLPALNQIPARSGALRAIAATLLAAVLGWGCAAPPGSDAGAGSPAGGAAAAAPVTVRLLGLNDFHGHLETGSNSLNLPDPATPGRTLRVATGGAALLAGLIRSERSAAAFSLVLSAGDLVGASPLASSLLRDEPTIEVMNALGLSINAVGNHEFDGGLDELLRLVRGGCAPPAPAGSRSMTGESCADPSRPFTGARFDDGPGRGFLAANVVRADGEPVLPAYAIHRFGGVPVAFVGVVTRNTPSMVSPSGVAGLRFLDEAQTLNRYARELRAQGVRTLVAVVHEGGETRGGWNDPSCPGARGRIFDIERRLDADYAVVFSGHSHQAYACRMGGQNGRIVVQSAAFGRALARVDLAIDPTSGRADLARSSVLNLPVVSPSNPPEVLAVYPAAQPDPAVQTLVDAAVQRAAPRARMPIGRLEAPITRRVEADSAGDHPAGRLIADAQLAATRAPGQGGAQVAFMNPGGIRGDFPCSPAPCDLSFGDAFAIQPFGNSLVVMTLSGAQLKSLLEQQARGVNAERARLLQPSAGLRYHWQASASAGQRVSGLEIEGRPVQDSDRIRVVVNSFLAEGGDGFSVLAEGQERTGGPLDLEALSRYLQASALPVPVPRDIRILRR